MDIKLGWKKRILWIPPFIIGMLVLLLAPSFKQAPPEKIKGAAPKVVRVMKIQPRNIQPTTTGYGYIQPTQDWQAQAELSGSIIWVTDALKNGAIINKGDTILKIDPAPFLLTKTQLKAQLDVARLKDKTIQASLNIAQQDYDLQQAELQRYERLNKSGNISNITRDASEREFLNSQQQLQTLKNTLLINRAEQKILDSQLAMIDLDLEKTTLRAPFDIRLTKVNIGIAEYINQGELLFEADGLSSVEVVAQFPIGKMRPLRRSSNKSSINKALHNELQAVVTLQAAGTKISWQGVVDRTGGYLDPQTQSQSIVVRIDNPYQQASPGKRPPLIRNTFVKVTLKAPILNKQLLLPTTAIHNHHVYVLDEHKKLQIKKVDIDFTQQNIAVIKSGLMAGDQVILSPLSPAIIGMKLKPQIDKKVLQWLNEATGFKVSKAPAKNQQTNDKKQGAL